jgi:hypothetical protein
MKKRTMLAFIIDNKVEKVLNTIDPMPAILTNGYSFLDKTSESSETPPGQFLFEISNEQEGSLTINADESLFAILQSNPLVVEIPEGLEVQIGWNYDGANFSA